MLTGPAHRPGTAASHGSAPATAARSVLLVEDDSMVRSWVRLALEGSEFHLAGETRTAEEAMEVCRRRQPALVLVDYRLPDGAGTEFVRELRRQGIVVPAVLMTANPEPGLNEAARDAGAQGSILKTGRSGHLLETLRAAVGGGAAFDPRHPRRVPGRAALSPREREAIRLVAAGRTNREIAEAFGVSTQTVKTILERTFAKLGARRRAQAVSAAHDAGLV